MAEVRIAVSIARLLKSFCVATPVKSVFQCVGPLPLSIDEYAARLGTYLYCSESALIAAAVIADRLYFANAKLFGERSLHKILAACAVIGAKFMDDKFFSNSYYADCAGVTLDEFNSLEASVLRILNFRVFVGPLDCQIMKVRLERPSLPTSPRKHIVTSRVPETPVVTFAYP